MDNVFNEKVKWVDRSCQFHFQGIIHYDLLESILNQIFNLQQKGVLVDLILLMNEKHKSIKITNTLMRLSSGGGQIYCCHNSTELQDHFILIDKSILIESSSENESIKLDYQTRIKTYLLNYNELLSISEPIKHQNGWPQINFSASKEWVKKGESIELNWTVDPAQSIFLQPLNISIPSSGNRSIQINEDVIFCIQAQNEHIIAEKRIFIKALSPIGIEFSLQISTNDGKDFVPLNAHPQIPFNYAVPPNGILKLEWVSDKIGILQEKDWGEIPNNGNRLVQFHEDKMLHFTWKTIFETSEILIYFYVIEDEVDSKKNHFIKKDNPVLALLKKSSSWIKSSTKA